MQVYYCCGCKDWRCIWQLLDGTLWRVKPIDLILTNIGTLAAFVLVSIAILILRHTQPNLRRGFRVPLVPLIPILSIIGSVVLIVSLPLVTLARFVVWLAIGLVIYFLYSRRSSRLQQEEVEDREADTIEKGA